MAFRNLRCEAYLPERLDTSKRFVRNRVLSLATPEEIDVTLVRQTVTNRRKIIKRGD